MTGGPLRRAVAGAGLVALLATAACATASPAQPPDVTTTSPSAAPSATPAAEPSETPSSPAVRVVEATPPASTTTVAPTRLGIPSLNLNLPVIPVGVAADGSMELPTSVRRVGWYRFGPDPTERRGTTVLAAHVDSKAEGAGPFAGLKNVDPGATITLRLADDVTRSYRVRSVRSYPKQQVPLDSVFDRTGSQRLVLITCGGAYDRSHGGYQDNVVVEADPR